MKNPRAKLENSPSFSTFQAMKRVEVVAGIIRSPQTSRFFATRRGYGEFKGGWEFPGGKVEPGETREAALVRELKEELAVTVKVEKFICTVEYDYPNFHLTMHTFLCTVESGTLTLLEHEDSKWLLPEELSTVDWLPADREVVNRLCGPSSSN